MDWREGLTQVCPIFQDLSLLIYQKHFGSAQGNAGLRVSYSSRNGEGWSQSGMCRHAFGRPGTFINWVYGQGAHGHEHWDVGRREVAFQV